MHHPPEVRFMVGASPWPRRFVWTVGALAMLQLSWYLFLNWHLSWRTAVVGLSFLVSMSVGLLLTMRPVKGALIWDGLQWHWAGFADDACTLKRHLDFQTLMLVSLHRSNRSPVWLWLQRAHGPQQFLALRRAVEHANSHGQKTHNNQSSAQARRAAPV